MQYREFISFLEDTGESFFIDVEGRHTSLISFINDYNSKYSPSISMDSEGICRLNDAVDKWSFQLRLYLNRLDGMPTQWLEKKHSNTHYLGNEYQYRIDDKNLIYELFDAGYRLGTN